MDSFTFINSRNQQIVFSTNETPLSQDTSSMLVMLAGYTGTSSAGIITPSTRGYNQNGYTLKNVNLGTRVIELEYYLRVSTDSDIYSYSLIRKKIVEILNPLLGKGLLIYNNGRDSYVLECVVSSMPKETSIIGMNMALMKTEFTAYNPLWRSLEKHSMRQPLAEGDYIVYDSFNNCFTNGDIPAPLNFKIYATPYRGYVRLEESISGGGTRILNDFEFRAPRNSDITYMELTTDYGNKNLWLATSGEKVLANRYITDPDFFTIPREKNLTVRYGVELSSAAPSGAYAELTYFDWYVGV